MKNKFIALTAAVISFLLTVGYLNADIVQKKIPLKQDFSSITLKANADLNISIGSSNQLIVETDSSVLKNLEVTITHNTLLLNTKDKHKKWWDVVGVFDKSKKITFNLTVKNLNDITIAGIGKIKIQSDISADDFTLTSMSAANITAKNISANNIKINILGEGNNKFTGLFATNSLSVNSRGSSHLYITKAETPYMELNIVGSATTTISKIDTAVIKSNIIGSGSASITGKAETQQLKLNGTGRYNGVELLTQSSQVTAYGGTSIEINAAKEFSLELFGTGIVNVNGQPTVKKCNIFGNGQLIFQSGSY